MTALADIYEEYEFLDADDRYRLLIDLGKVIFVRIDSGAKTVGF